MDMNSELGAHCSFCQMMVAQSSSTTPPVSPLLAFQSHLMMWQGPSQIKVRARADGF